MLQLPLIIHRRVVPANAFGGELDGRYESVTNTDRIKVEMVWTAGVDELVLVQRGGPVPKVFSLT